MIIRMYIALSYERVRGSVLTRVNLNTIKCFFINTFINF